MPTALLAIAHLTVSSAHAQADRTWEAAALLRETQVAGFGESVASGDFDGDGVQELALGHPAEQSLSYSFLIRLPTLECLSQLA